MKDPHLAPVAQKDSVRGHVQRQGPEMRENWDVYHASPGEGVSAPTSAWAADKCSIALGQQVSGEEEKFYGELVRAAGERELILRPRHDTNSVPWGDFIRALKHAGHGVRGRLPGLM